MNRKINPELGNALRQARKEARISLRKAGKEMGISPSRLSKLERAKILMDSLEEMLKVSKFYNIPIEQIVELRLKEEEEK